MSRTDQIKAERRRRNSDALGGHRQRLFVNEAQLDRENYQYRWANDVDNRIYQLTVQDDYERVEDRDGSVRPDNSGMGAEVATPVGTTKEGAPMRAVLLRKPKTFHDDDERAKHRAIDETEASLKAGAVPGAGNEGTYAKDEMSFRRGAR